MKAYYSFKYGGGEASRYGDYPDPVAGPGQLLVEVKAVSINPVDFKVRNGSLKFLTGSKFPRILGTDFSGIVKQRGSGVTKFREGDRVYGLTSVIFGNQGALAQLLSVGHDKVNPIPPEISFEVAASLPVAALTALNGLRRCGIREGSKVLINGGTGGVGHFAIQIARAKGAHVTVTCSEKNEALAKSLGANETMGYSVEDFVSAGRQFDIVYDAWGHMRFSDINRLLKRNGTYASTMPDPFRIFKSLPVILLYGKKLTSSNLRSKQEDFDEMERLLLSGKLKPLIENFFTLDKADEAFDLAEHGKPRGKIVVRVL